jgi:hypothetical protein
MMPVREQEKTRKEEATRIAGEAILAMIQDNPGIFEEFLDKEAMDGQVASAPLPPGGPPMPGPMGPAAKLPGELPLVKPPFPMPPGPGGPMPPPVPIDQRLPSRK